MTFTPAYINTSASTTTIPQNAPAKSDQPDSGSGALAPAVFPVATGSSHRTDSPRLAHTTEAHLRVIILSGGPAHDPPRLTTGSRLEPSHVQSPAPAAAAEYGVVEARCLDGGSDGTEFDRP